MSIAILVPGFMISLALKSFAGLPTDLQSVPPETLSNQDLALISTGIILYLPFWWSAIAIGIKRFHDRGKTGWWVLIGAIPYIGTLWYVIELGLFPGDDMPNRYGILQTSNIPISTKKISTNASNNPEKPVPMSTARATFGVRNTQ